MATAAETADAIWAAIQRASPPVTRDEILALLEAAEGDSEWVDEFAPIPEAAFAAVKPGTNPDELRARMAQYFRDTSPDPREKQLG